MADVLTNFTPIIFPEAFNELPRGENHYYPRARLNFTVSGDVIPAKLAGNTNSIEVEMNLPVGFGYTIDYVNAVCVMDVGEAGHFQSNGLLDITPTGSLGAGDATPYFTQLTSEGSTPNIMANEAKIYCSHPGCSYKNLIYNLGSTSPQLNLRVTDDHADATAAGSFFMRVGYLQYDINQILDVALNSPLPVRTI